ncbi:hypothetical protein FGIG_05190 [Fasciola gigantica]|uniref:Uncharacterized protein n=1 Tax=Fasciola gigantica TaxID=46835 RepID=A0A504YSJ4_FASGI|nr:hypothetical protein FGIG_05190 [Fasciola gigantica]
MMNFVNLYYPGPPGPYGPPGTTPTGILTPTGFYPNPHHPNMPMMLGAPSVSVAPFNTYPTLLQTSYPAMPYMSGQSMTGGFPVPGVVPVSQPLLGSGPLAYASPLYWNAPVSTSVIAASLNTSASPSTTGSQVGVVTDTILATKSSLVTGTNPFIDVS